MKRSPVRRRRMPVVLSMGLAVGASIAACSVAGRVRTNPDPSPRAWSAVQLGSEAIETVFYDAFAKRARAGLAPEHSVAYVQVSDNDVFRLYQQKRIGWPWPREIIAGAAAAIRDAGATAVVLDITLSGSAYASDERQAAADLERSRTVVALDTLVHARTSVTAFRELAGSWALGPKPFASRAQALEAGREAYLASVQPPVAGLQPVLLPETTGWSLWFAGFPDRATALANLPDLSAVAGPGAVPRELEPDEQRHLLTLADLTMERYAVQVAGDGQLADVPRYESLLAPSELFIGAVRRFGVVTARLEPDSVFRRAQYLAAVEDPNYPGPTRRHYLPSLALAAAMEFAGVAEVSYRDGALGVGRYRVPVERDASALVEFPPDSPHVYPMIDVLRLLDQEMPDDERREWTARLAEVVKDRIVVVSNEAKAMLDVKASPVSAFTSGSRIVAAQLSTLLRGTPIRRVPAWVDVLLCVAFAVANVLIVVFLTLRDEPKLVHYLGTLACFLLLAGFHFVAAELAFRAHWWVAYFAPALASGGAAMALSLVYAIASVGRERARIQEWFGRHTSPDLVKHLREHPEDWNAAGQLRELTVYFSDIRGFTTMSEALDPQDTVEFLKEYFSALADKVTERKGIVDKFIGDAIMAFWGALPRVEDHALLGCESALAMRDELARRRPEFKRRYEARYRARHGSSFTFDVHARAGLSTGPMVVGQIGSERKRNYTVIGDTVNLASRLEGANKFYGTEILCSEGTYLAARGAFEFREVGVVKVKGKAKGTRIYELLGAKGLVPAGKTAVCALFEQGLAAFTQRRFTEAVSRFESALAGDPGDGPSRLYLEITRSYGANPPPPDWDGSIEMHDK